MKERYIVPVHVNFLHERNFASLLWGVALAIDIGDDFFFFEEI